MSIVTTTEMFKKAYKEGYALVLLMLIIWKLYRELWKQPVS